MAEGDQPTRLDLNGMTRNLRHRTLVNKMCQHLKEMIGAGTGNEPQIDRFDYERLRDDYIPDWRAIIAGQAIAGAVLTRPASERPEVDQPLTRDDWWEVQKPISMPDNAMENVYWEELCIRLRKFIREITNAQSALYSNNWHPKDPPRWNAYFSALEYDLANIVGNIEPTDEVLTRPSAQPHFENVGVQLDVGGATNKPGHPMAD
jgi:hypothetical protein